MPDCPGSRPVRGKWYGVLRGELPGVSICEACYEDKVVGTFYAHNFGPANVGALRVCHFGLPFVERTYSLHSVNGTTNWKEFAKAVEIWNESPSCSGLCTKSGRVWVTSPANPSIAVCQAHFLAEIAHTPLAYEFNILEDACTAAVTNSRITCGFGNHALVHAFRAALDVQDFTVFTSAVGHLSLLPTCPGRRIQSSLCYVLKGYQGSFVLCETCFYGYIQPLSLTSLFNEEDHFRHEFKCSLHYTTPHRRTTVSKILEVANKGTIQPLTKHLNFMPHLPPCPGDTPTNSCSWRSFPGSFPLVTICPACAMTIVAATPLRGKLASTPPTEEAFTCALGSDALRANFYRTLRPVTGDEWAEWMEEARKRGERLKKAMPLVDEYRRVINRASESIELLEAREDVTGVECVNAVQVLEKEKQDAETLLDAAMRVLE